MAEIKPIQYTKKLPRNNQGLFKATFPANGKEYRIVSTDYGFPLSRDTVAAKFIMMVMANGDYSYNIGNIVRTETIVDGVWRNKNQIGDLSAHLAAWKKEVQDISTAKYLWWHYLCTTFILAPGEDIRNEWSQSEAETKLEDWGLEGYVREDFMELAGLFIQAYNAESDKLMGLIVAAATKAVEPQKRSGGTDRRKIT